MSDKGHNQDQQVAKNETKAELEQAAQEQKLPDSQQQITLQSVVEAILFASNEPLEASKVAKVAGMTEAPHL